MGPAAAPAEAVGHAVARVLAGSWRRTPPPPPVLADLALAAPTLLATGGGALGWWRLRGAPPESVVAEQLHDAYRQHAAQAARHAQERRGVLAALAAAGIDPIVVKGWAVARLYAEPGLRPYGDLDVVLAAGERDRARRALAPLAIDTFGVDLHDELRGLDRPFADLAAATRDVADGPRTTRVPSAAHHLRFVCLHLLGHGAWRPSWLCDVGACLENDAPDWDELLAGEARRTEWVRATLRLAGDLLGADLGDAPAPVRAQPLPAWLTGAVLAAWSRPFVAHGNRAPLATVPLVRPLRLARSLLLRWPNPVEATVGLGAAFDERPRLPHQVAFAVRRLARALRRPA